MEWNGRRERAVYRKPFALHTTSNTFLGRADFDFFLRFENTASRIMFDDMVARANPICLPAFSRSDRRVGLLLVARVDCPVLYCAVLDNSVLAVRRW